MSQIVRSVNWRYQSIAEGAPACLHVDCHRCGAPFIVANGVMHGGRVIGRITCKAAGCGWTDFAQLDGFDELVESGCAGYTRHR